MSLGVLFREYLRGGMVVLGEVRGCADATGACGRKAFRWGKGA
jgi:hypothetical protein